MALSTSITSQRRSSHHMPISPSSQRTSLITVLLQRFSGGPRQLSRQLSRMALPSLPLLPHSLPSICQQPLRYIIIRFLRAPQHPCLSSTPFVDSPPQWQPSDGLLDKRNATPRARSTRSHTLPPPQRIPGPHFPSIVLTFESPPLASNSCLTKHTYTLPTSCIGYPVNLAYPLLNSPPLKPRAATRQLTRTPKTRFPVCFITTYQYLSVANF